MPFWLLYPTLSHCRLGCIGLTGSVIVDCKPGDQTILIEVLCKLLQLGVIVQDGFFTFGTPSFNICNAQLT